MMLTLARIGGTSTAIAGLLTLSFTTCLHAGEGSLTPQKFVERAAFSNAFEIEAAKLALEKAHDVAAKTFAQDMFVDHGKAGTALANAAAKENVQVRSGMDDKGREKIDALKASSEKDFDQAYLATQVSAHEEAVALFDEFTKASSGGALKTFAETTLGTLRAHNVRIHGLTKD